MALIKRYVAALAVCLCFNGSAMASMGADYTITYKNQQGSMLTLTWHPEKNGAGTLNGMMTAASGNCRGTPAPVAGVFMGNAVAITVNYAKCDKVVAMTGNLRNSNTELQMIWLAASQARDSMRDYANQVGSDTYVKVAS